MKAPISEEDSGRAQGGSEGMVACDVLVAA